MHKSGGKTLKALKGTERTIKTRRNALGETFNVDLV